MYHRLVVALDGSPLAERALPGVEALAERFGSQLFLLRALPHPGSLVVAAPVPGAVVDPVAAVGEDPQVAVSYLQSVVRRLTEQGLQAECVVRDGDAAEVIAGYALEIEADLIAMTTHGHGGVRRALLGSVADAVVRNAPCPVLLVRVPDEARR